MSVTGNPKNPSDYYGLRYANFVAPLVKAGQEQQEESNELKTIITNLEARLSVLEKE